MLSKNVLISQRIALSFVVPLLALIAIGTVSLRNQDSMERESALVTHTVEVMAQIRQLNEFASRIESSARGFLLSGDESLRNDFSAQQASAGAALRKLRALTADNPSQVPHLDRYEALLATRVARSQDLVDLRTENSIRNPARVAELVRTGQKLSDDLRQAADDLNNDEAELLAQRQESARRATLLSRNTIIYGSALSALLVLASGLILSRSITRPLAKLRASANRIGEGDYAHRADVEREDETGHLGSVFNRMAAQVEQRQTVLRDQAWLKTALTNLSASFQQHRDPGVIGQVVLRELATLIGAQPSAIYRVMPNDGAEPHLELCASYATENLPARLAMGEGVVGQCGLERRRVVLTEIPANYLRLSSSLGGAQPAVIVIEPVPFEGRAKAVLELASRQAFTPIQLDLIEQLAAHLGVAFQNIESVNRTEDLLRQSQALTAQLENQQAVLAEKNTELERQTDQLKKSEKLLQEQQVELTQTNEELEQTNEEMEQANEEMEEKTNLLAQQKRELEISNRTIEQARLELQEKARQLSATSTYKSNFLATMSHELRTPLNSLLILARLLGENRDANLTPKQVQFAHTIEASGADLLELINQILDLAKIESGTVDLQLGDVAPAELAHSMEQQFRHVAESKKLQFEVTVEPGLPPQVRTDVGRLHQVLKNLLSNAFKFTEHGTVKVSLRKADAGWSRSVKSLNEAPAVIAFAVSDTGIGVPKEKQEIIFESFQQADAGTARRFGGTGLGLSISREIAAMLGGILQLESDPGHGSTFTLYLPAVIDEKTIRAASVKPPQTEPPESGAAPAANPRRTADEPAPELLEFEDHGVADDRDTIVPSDRVLLIVEDDLRFAAILKDFAHEKRFKVLLARTARHGLALALRFVPVAITLDLRLVDEDGWHVLDRLKHDQRTRHIPVHVISVEPARSRGLRLGAVSYLQKPVTKEDINQILEQTVAFIERPVKNLLVVEDDPAQRDSIRELIGNGDVHTTTVGTAAETLRALASERYDCIVMDLMLPDQAGVDLIREINRRLGLEAPPVIVYTGKELSPREETELRSLSESIIVKDARSPERLLDETALFLHRVQAKLPESKRRMLEQVRRQDAILTGRHVLIVDDDVRNIFALTAALESYGMIVTFTESGAAAVKALQTDPTCDAVLMDVMMPEMDGNETTRRLRADPRFAKLPIIAVTAKAMKGDRERSIDAGASDYITKPVDTEKLISLLRVWLYR